MSWFAAKAAGKKVNSGIAGVVPSHALRQYAQPLTRAAALRMQWEFGEW